LRMMYMTNVDLSLSSLKMLEVFKKGTKKKL
jgi:hypothetical protein